MREDLSDRIKTLSQEERALVFYKLKGMMRQDLSLVASEKPKRLVAYIQPFEAYDQKAVKSYLKDRLPNYMVPSSITVVDKIPLLPNGKLDKSKLRSSVTKEANTVAKTKEKSSKIEAQLVGIWEAVLNFNPINTDDNFFEIGGDSILSIQIIAKARKLGMAITPNQLFNYQTIAELALFVTSESADQADIKSLVMGPLPLSPIQHWFFETHKTAPHHWNQAVELLGLPPLEEKQLRELVGSLIAHHDSLRTCFEKKEGKWTACISTPEVINALTYIDISKDGPERQKVAIEQYIAEAQSAFDLSKGGLFKCLYFNTGKDRVHSCILLAHHLVVDAVSWQILIEDVITAIEDLKAGKAINLPDKTTSAKAWGSYLNDVAIHNIWKDELDFWKEHSLCSIPVPRDFNGEIPLLEKDVLVAECRLGTEIMNKMSNGVHDTYNTKTDELLIIAFVKTIAAWSKSQNVHIGLERHGRETHNSGLDLSNTVGWLTAYYPLKLEIKDIRNIGEIIISVKELLRKIPNGGQGYGVHRYIGEAIEKSNYPEIVFNFLGVRNKTKTGKKIRAEAIAIGTRHPLSERNYLLEINTFIQNDALIMYWSYGATFHRSSTIEALIAAFRTNLNEIIDHCSDTENMTYTPSDFPDVALDQHDLDNLLSTLD